MQTMDGNYAVVGTMNGDVSLIVVDKWGNKILSKTYGGANGDGGNAIAQTTDGQYFYLVGNTMSFITDGIVAAYLLKVDAQTGNLISSRSFQGNGTCMNTSGGWSVLSTNDGGCIFSGGSGAFCLNYAGIFVVKTDTNGNLVFSNIYGGFDGSNEIGTSIEKTSDGYIICTDGFSLIKIDSIGNEQWVKNYWNNIDAVYGNSVKETSDRWDLSQ